MAFSKKSVIMHPCARSERLLIENIDDETVIYDEESKTAHALKPLAAAVFLYADGKNSLGEIAELASYRLGTAVSEAQISEAVTELDECALLDVPELEDGVSRRDALKRFGAVGVAAGAGTMLISSIAAPVAFAGLANQGANYICGTGSNNVTSQNISPAQSWPQPPDSSNWENWIGTKCDPNGKTNYYCVVNGVHYKNVPLSACTSGNFCVNPSLSYVNGVSNQVNCQSGTHAGDPNCSVKQKSSSSATQYWAVPQDLCTVGTSGRNPTAAGQFCVDSGGDYIESLTTQAQCTVIGGNSWIDLSGYSSASWSSTGNGNGTWVSTSGTMTPDSGNTNGTFVGIPCDGNVNGAHYQCAEIACVTNGDITSKSPFITSESTFAKMYSVSGEFSGWPSKYCASGKCNDNGTCS